MESGSTAIGGLGSSLSLSDSLPLQEPVSLTFVGLPAGWITLITRGLGTLLVQKRGDVTDVSIYTDSYSSLPIGGHVEALPPKGVRWTSGPSPGNGGSTDTEERKSGHTIPNSGLHIT